MILIWGSKFYGKVDELPGGPHVATRFGHLWYIPLIPMGSSLILAKQGSSIRHVPVGLSFKSVLTAWGQAALILLGILAVIVGVGMLSTQHGGRPDVGAAVILFVAALLGFGGAWGLSRVRFIRRPSYVRAVSLAERAGYSEEGLIMIEVAYGRVSEEEGLAAIQELTKMTQDALAEQERPASPAAEIGDERAH